MTDTETWLTTAVEIAAVGIMRAAVEEDGREFTDKTWLSADEEGREMARHAAREAISALRTAGMLATPEHRAAIIRELVGTDEEPGVLDRYFVHTAHEGAGPVVWHCRRDDHVSIIARNLPGDRVDQTDLTVGELAQAALDHEIEVHDGA